MHHLKINPFIICDVAAQACADRERWQFVCWSLGATQTQTDTWDEAARAYAATTIYPNHDVVNYLRQLAREALARGESWPESIDAVLEAEHQRALRRLFPPGFFA